ncbi:hypothetical protein HDU76_002657 [Blyttiomyces sp. JEL0837]|nr:hypothetical protein HDU76_002657 [Blyttiomyces sp. JEL0837]
MMKQSRRGDKNIRMQHYKTSVSKVNEAVKAFWQVQSEIKSSNRDQIVRQYRIARPGASDQEIQNALDSGRADVFSQEILSSRVADQQRILGAVQDRQKQLEQITKSMEELVSLTQELQHLIDEQTYLIDETDQHVENTVQAVQSGVAQLEVANKKAASARKKKWIIFWIVLIFLIVVGAAIAIYIKTQKQ